MDERDYKAMNEELNQPSCLGAVISRLFLELATKHNVKVDDLNLHISCKTLYIQKYTPNGKNEYECLEMVDLNGL
jgi:hypothetical protein